MAKIVGTWRFSTIGVNAAKDALNEGKSALDAVTQAVKLVERDGTIGSVGYGGMPDERGVLALDAAVMTGCGRVGAVMSLEGRRSAVDVARLVLERSPHSQLAGDGAAKFAENNGLETESELVTPHASRRYAQWNGTRDENVRKHTDTVGILCRDKCGSLAVAAASSGAEFKAHGRVGDTPIVGSGLYAENESGAAVATGDGDKMITHCIAVRVVDRMKSGAKPTDACIDVLRRVAAMDSDCQAAVVAMDSDGTIGAGTTHRGFFVVTWDEVNGLNVMEAEWLNESEWIHSGV